MSSSEREHATRSARVRCGLPWVLAGLLLSAAPHAHADSPIALKAGATTPQTELKSPGLTLGGALSGPRWRPTPSLVLAPQLELFLARRHTGVVPDAAGRSAYTLDFLELPLLLRGEFVLGGHSFYAMAGAYGSLLLRAEETSVEGLISPANMAGRADFGLLAAGGLSFASSPWGELFAEVRYQQGYRSLLPQSAQKHQVVSLLLGYGLGADAVDAPSSSSGDRGRRLTLKGGLVATRFQSPGAAASTYMPGFAFGGAFSPARFGSWVALVPQVELAFVHRGEHRGVAPDGALSLDDVDVSALVRGEVAVADRALYGLAGVYGSVLIRAQRNHDGEIIPMRDAVRPLDAGWLAGAGIDVARLGDAELSLEVRYQRGFSDRLAADEYAATQQSLSCALGITYGSPSIPQGTRENEPTVLYSANDQGDAKKSRATRRVTSVRIGRVGDRWLQDIQFLRIERARRDEEYGYRVTYHIAGHGELVFFWSRNLIDFDGSKSWRYRGKVMTLKRGRLWYPTRVTSRSLPAVHRWILELEEAYAKQANGAIEAMEGFVIVAWLGGIKPTLRATAPRGGSRAGVSTSRLPSARTATEGVITGFSAAESAIIHEARRIVSSAKFAQLRAAHAAGRSATVRIGGRLIQYEPGLPASGLTMFGENGFLIGREAFASHAELGKTVLHELYRLRTSASAGGVSGSLAASEAAAAFDFAERAIGVLW